MILVVGATGELGTTIVRKLVAVNQPVRAFVRRTTCYQRFQGCVVELAFGDLCDPTSVDDYLPERGKSHPNCQRSYVLEK